MQHIQQYLTDLKIALDALDPAQIERCGIAWRRCARAADSCSSVATAAALPRRVTWANDVGYDVVFAEQLRNLGQSGDVLLAISGSGNSPNILAAVRIAREIGMEVIAWTGFGGGELAGVADMAIVADSHHMGRVEDVHTILMHLVCYYFMEEEAQA